MVSIDFTLIGGSGGTDDSGNYNIAGGRGGVVSGRLNVSDLRSLYFVVGGAGQARCSTCTSDTVLSGGYNNGGRSGYSVGGGGGGATDIRIASNSLSSRLVVAGGGGGGSLVCSFTG